MTVSHPRLLFLLVIAVALASPAAIAQSIKPMDPAEIARLGSAQAAPSPQPLPRSAPEPAPARQAEPVRSAAHAPAQATAPAQQDYAAQVHGWPSEQADPTPAARPPAQAITTIPAGSRLSEALEVFINSHGWSLRWLIEEDYMLDADLPIPGSDVIDAVTWVVQTYQRQGGMHGVVPRFARGNRVVAIEKMDVRG